MRPASENTVERPLSTISRRTHADSIASLRHNPEVVRHEQERRIEVPLEVARIRRI